jgi:hypothetical protein
MRGGTEDKNGNGVGRLTGGTNEVFTFLGNRFPIPLEELNDDLCQEHR